MSDVDDGKRGPAGIIVSVVDNGDESVSLVFDRVLREGRAWRATAFVTAKRLQRQTLLEMKMSDEDLAAFGLVLAAELSAALGRQLAVDD